jgi:hypothetical protein
MDDGMGVVRDDPDESVIGRYAHFADGPLTRNVYTSDSEVPDEAYADWKHLDTFNLDRDPGEWR